MTFITKILDSTYGCILVSAFIGFALASLFRMTCKYKNCLQYIAPSTTNMHNTVFRWDDKCYRAKRRFVSCGGLSDDTQVVEDVEDATE